MADPKEQAKQPQKSTDSGPRSAPENLDPAEDQHGSLKVHGDKLEKLIPRAESDG
jgi:hypothetical protein